MLSRLSLLGLMLLIVGAMGLFTFLRTVEQAPVSLARLRMFARRHNLTITADNGNQVIRYLATTRRWRVAGLVGGLLISVSWALRDSAVRVDFLSLFAGWFVGALIAEIRLARTSFGPRRAASLTARVPVMYLPRFAWWLTPVAAAISVAIGAGTVALAVRLDVPIDPTAGVLGALAVIIALVVHRVRQRVLHRPQPVDAADVVAADDAIRSRSLHVLTGGGLTLVLYCVIGQFSELIPLAAHTSRLVAVAQAIPWLVAMGAIGSPTVGWVLANASWRVVRPAAGSS